MSENVNMVGMTDEESQEYAQKDSWGCLIASICIVALALLFVGWMAYLACCRWQRLEDMTVLGIFPAAGALCIAVKAMVKGV